MLEHAWASSPNWEELVANLPKVRVLVIGDLILDHYIYGRTERTSPEAPVPVVVFERESMIPGGAANVARNAARFGAQTWCMGVVGNDQHGEMLRELLRAQGVDCSGILSADHRPTTVKTRIISHNQQMLRLDREVTAPLSKTTEHVITEKIDRLVPLADVVVASDYAKGVLSPKIFQHIGDVARQHRIPVFVDPKGRNYQRYRGAFALTPNAKEAAEASGFDTSTEEGIRDAAKRIFEVTDCSWVIITRGAHGAAVCAREEAPVFIPTLAKEVFDVTGAGDSFITFLALAVGAGIEITTAAHIANAAAGVVVGKIGAATVSPQELLEALVPEMSSYKVIPAENLPELGDRLRKSGKRIVFTNGCFDFLHAGHVALLQEAKRLGDVLVVAINSDEMIRRLKGEPRPILKQHERERLLSAIEAVDYIVVFEDATPHRVLELLRPDVLVKGSNYRPEEVEGHEVVESYGGQVVLIKTLESISTKELVTRHRSHQKS